LSKIHGPLVRAVCLPPCAIKATQARAKVAVGSLNLGFRTVQQE